MANVTVDGTEGTEGLEAQARVLMAELEPELEKNRVTTAGRAAILAALKVPVPDEEARRDLTKRCKRFAQRHGWRQTERTWRVSRYYLGLLFADMLPNNGQLWGLLAFYAPAGDEFEAQEQAKADADKKGARP